MVRYCQTFILRNCCWQSAECRVVHSMSEERFEDLLTPALLCHKDTAQCSQGYYGIRAPIICKLESWKCHKDTAKGKKCGLWVTWAVSLWHRRADIATPWDQPIRREPRLSSTNESGPGWCWLTVDCYQEVMAGLVLLRQAVSDWCGDNLTWYWLAHSDLTDR